MNLSELSSILHDAAKTAKPIAQLSLSHPINLDQAYEIQRLLVQHRIDEGHPLIGIKMGFTSKAKMEQMGVDDMIWGLLTSDMLIEEGGALKRNAHCHPRAEPEICFKTSIDIDRELSLEECKEAVSHVAAAVEIIDSRYENFKFSLEDVVADNCSSAGMMIGPWVPMKEDLRDLKMTMHLDDELAAEGSSNAILDDPWNSFQAATRLASAAGMMLPAGSCVMAGASTPASFVKEGQKVKVEVEGLGSLILSVA